ncbi:MAG: GIY-YIG nuclease family protein [Alphaproteobacteria bacterium]
MQHAINTTTDLEVLPAVAGAYLLVIHLEEAAALPEHFRGLHLPAGCYLYAGNANGHGGIRSRCRRHLRAIKAKHWHVDWLTSVASDLAAVAFPGASECALIAGLLDRSGVRSPVPGFGSTDCRHCPSHLVQIDGPRTAGFWRELLASIEDPDDHVEPMRMRKSFCPDASRPRSRKIE